MKSGRITIGISIIALSAIVLFGIAIAPSVFAGTTETETGATGQVIINGFVSITLYNASIQFSAMNPGTTNQPANASGGFPLVVQVDAATTVDIAVCLNASDFATGGYTLMSENMSFNVTGPAGGTANATCNAAGACPYSQAYVLAFNETSREAGAENASIHNYLTVPAGQKAGTYTNKVFVYAKQGPLTC